MSILMVISRFQGHKQGRLSLVFHMVPLNKKLQSLLFQKTNPTNEIAYNYLCGCFIFLLLTGQVNCDPTIIFNSEESFI